MRQVRHVHVHADPGFRLRHRTAPGLRTRVDRLALFGPWLQTFGSDRRGAGRIRPRREQPDSAFTVFYSAICPLTGCAMHVIQILLPIYDNEGKKFSQALYGQIGDELVARFSGLTAYMRAPAQGFWARGNETA